LCGQQNDRLWVFPVWIKHPEPKGDHSSPYSSKFGNV